MTFSSCILTILGSKYSNSHILWTRLKKTLLHPTPIYLHFLKKSGNHLKIQQKNEGRTSGAVVSPARALSCPPSSQSLGLSSGPTAEPRLLMGQTVRPAHLGPGWSSWLPILNLSSPGCSRNLGSIQVDGISLCFSIFSNKFSS